MLAQASAPKAPSAPLFFCVSAAVASVKDLLRYILTVGFVLAAASWRMQLGPSEKMFPAQLGM